MSFAGSLKANDWNSGLCGCCCDDCGSFIEACCCSCYQVSAQHTKLSRFFNNNKVATPDDLCMCMLCCDVAITAPLCCFTLCSTVQVRSEIRRKYNIEGSCLGDCLTVYCCMPCALSQQYRELGRRNNWPGSLCLERPYSDFDMLERSSRAPSQAGDVTGKTTFEWSVSAQQHVFATDELASVRGASPSITRTRSQPKFI